MKTVIFDFNGTMFFDEDKQILSWKVYAKQKFGYTIQDEEFQPHIHGHNNAEILAYLAKREFSKEETLRMATEKEYAYQKLCMDDKKNLHLAPGLVTFLDWLKANRVPLAICTGSMKPNVIWYYETFGLGKWFKKENIVYDDQTIVHGKPDPEIYQKAIARMKAKPAEVLVFEDSMGGIESARRAKVGRLIAIEPKAKLAAVKKVAGVDDAYSDFTALGKEVYDFLQR